MDCAHPVPLWWEGTSMPALRQTSVMGQATAKNTTHLICAALESCDTAAYISEKEHWWLSGSECCALPHSEEHNSTGINGSASLFQWNGSASLNGWIDGWMVGSELRGKAHSLYCVIFREPNGSQHLQPMSSWSLDAPFSNCANYLNVDVEWRHRMKIILCFLGLFLSVQAFFVCFFLSITVCVLFTTGVLSRSLSSSSSSLDSPHGPSPRPRPLPRQRLPGRTRRHRVLLSPRGAPSPALHPSPETTALSTARLCQYNFSGLIIDLVMTAGISGISLDRTPLMSRDLGQ